MLDWVGKDRPMKMGETSRGADKKLYDNNSGLPDRKITYNWGRKTQYELEKQSERLAV